jgi:hypothetical protein
MALHFIMPPDGFERRLVDAVFRQQAESLRAAGFGVSLVPDDIFDGRGELRGIPSGATVVYRGWMVKPERYRRLEEAIAHAGATLLTNAIAYRLAHHLPNWYDALREFTPRTVWFKAADELVPTLRSLGWGRYFLKDYVKSLKTGGGSVVETEEDALRWLRETLAYRDELEGGICVREFENLLPDSEIRYFVLDGVPHAPAGQPIPAPVDAAAQKIASPFFSVDVAINDAGRHRIVEIGDGQVSDLVGWTPEKFAEVWRSFSRRIGTERSTSG